MNKRGLVSFLTLFGFLVMALTGLVLYAMPEGRVAYWIHWKMMGLSKTDWGNIHILSSVLFIVAGGFHIGLNWKPLINYFRDKVRRGIRLQRELAVSSILAFWIVVSAIWPFPPLSYLLDFNEWVKASWVTHDDYEPPFGHAELMSLRAFCKKMDIDPAKSAEELRTQGIRFAGDRETLEEIGLANDISPMNLYLMIKKFEPVPEPEELQSYTPESVEVEFSGSGIGNKSIRFVCEKTALEPELARKRLAAAGIAADLDQTVMSVAESARTQPMEILKILLVEGYKPAQQ
ncbi:MAG: DUF4405 domain-containing protein [Acidobacteria bacterium]|nr:DUF4405 domain-containing protein [Acidobacteriota bacterium]